MWFNIKHLTDASTASNTKMSYIKHFGIAFSEFIFCLLMALGSLLHAIFPWVIDFKLIEYRINRLKKLKEKFPNDPYLTKVKFDE